MHEAIENFWNIYVENRETFADLSSAGVVFLRIMKTMSWFGKTWSDKDSFLSVGCAHA